MGEVYLYQPDVAYPNLFFEVSQGVRWLVENYKMDYTKAELVFMRRGALGRLENMGINEKTYDPGEHHFTKIETCYLELNELYDTYHSFADVNKFRD
jgi:hypothetical protein